MRGRVVQKTPLNEIRVLFETVNPVPNAAPTYNGAPTDRLPVVRIYHDGRRSHDLLRWGLVPWWARTQDRRALYQRDSRDGRDQAGLPRRLRPRAQRCIVPVDAFYE